MGKGSMMISVPPLEDDDLVKKARNIGMIDEEDIRWVVGRVRHELVGPTGRGTLFIVSS